jgi:hypothetical protein
MMFKIKTMPKNSKVPKYSIAFDFEMAARDGCYEKCLQFFEDDQVSLDHMGLIRQEFMQTESLKERPTGLDHLKPRLKQMMET